VNLGDPEVSRRHCILKIYGEDVVLIDMESTNGTFIQGKRVMTARLRKDEPFTVGNTTLVLTTAG
jgi:pSer/pThr/pTyr-binding forkhead associated (FHA) protein